MKEPSDFDVKATNEELIKVVSEIEKCEPECLSTAENLPQREREALRQLKKAEDIIIKKADKGNTLVVLDTPFYRDKLVLSDHLNTDTYSIAPLKADQKVHNKLTKLIEKHKNCLTKKEADYIVKREWQSSNFYVLPKIHKSKEIIDKFKQTNTEYVEMTVPGDLKGRPITAGPKAPTRGLSELLEKILSPLVPRLKTYVKDDKDFLSRIPRQVDYDCELISCDIVSLYTNIPHELGIEAVRYWVERYPELIPQRFTTEFIVESVLFVLENNFFMFDGICRHQVIGTAMGTVMAPPYACLSIGYLEETRLEPVILPRYFSREDCRLILEILMRYIDDGFITWPKRLNLQHFIDALNSLHPSIKFTIERGEEGIINGLRVQILNFLDVLLILHLSGKIETDIYYKPTNSHDYLSYDSHHPEHTKKNIVYGLAKRIVEFVSNYDTEEIRMNELYKFLIACKYPPSVIKTGIRNARLQGPGPNPANKTRTIPFVSTHSSNYSSNRIVKRTNTLLNNLTDDRMKTAFQESKVVLALKQPPNLLRHLSKASFISTKVLKPNGIFLCGRSYCDICNFYLQPCTSFITSNGVEWTVQSHITCHSKCVIYFLKCLSCGESTTYTGRTNILRKRTNNHISECRSGVTSDRFDRHVYHCNKRGTEPAFKMYVFVELSNANLLEEYEKYLHKMAFDTMNS